MVSPSVAVNPAGQFIPRPINSYQTFIPKLAKVPYYYSARRDSGRDYIIPDTCKFISQKVRLNLLEFQVGSWAGNLMMKHAHPEFPSDVFTIMEAAGAKVTLGRTIFLPSLRIQLFQYVYVFFFNFSIFLCKHAKIICEARNKIQTKKIKKIKLKLNQIVNIKPCIHKHL